jgi:hypothetical protein
MTVCTDELAFGDLIEDHRTTVAVDESAEIVFLDGPGEMIPLHRSVMEPSSAIDTRRIL